MTDRLLVVLSEYGCARNLAADRHAELSPRMDELFLTALRELAAPL